MPRLAKATARIPLRMEIQGCAIGIDFFSLTVFFILVLALDLALVTVFSIVG